MEEGGRIAERDEKAGGLGAGQEPTPWSVVSLINVDHFVSLIRN